MSENVKQAKVKPHKMKYKKVASDYVIVIVMVVLMTVVFVATL